MKIMTILGSPKRNGNTATVLLEVAHANKEGLDFFSKPEKAEEPDMSGKQNCQK